MVERMIFLGCGCISTIAVFPGKRLVREIVSDANSEVVRVKWIAKKQAGEK